MPAIMGREVLLTLDLAGGLQLKVLVAESAAPPPGSEVGLDLSAAHLHHFDAEGRRIAA